MRYQTQILNDINIIKDKNMQVCVFGCGNIGKGAGHDILKFLGIEIKYYSDNDPCLWGKTIKESIKCIPPRDLAHMADIACFILVGVRFHEEIIRQLKEYDIQIIITSFELYSLDVIINNFITSCGDRIFSDTKDRDVIFKEGIPLNQTIENENQKECAVYTCIIGDYDSVNEPEFYSERCDYYLISDREPSDLKIYKWIDANKIIPETVKDNRRKNRFCKINGSAIFSKYDFSIYIDGNIQITGDVSKYISKTGKCGIAAFKFPGLDCLYEHAIATAIAGVEDNREIFQQVDFYYREGMPRNFGLVECGILVRDNRSPICRKVMREWWNEVFNRSCRDQSSFTYCLWKNKLSLEDVGILGENMRRSDDFRMVSHHHYMNGKWIG